MLAIILYKVYNNIDWDIWCFGHYHADRIERPGVEQFFKDTDNLKTVWDRWIKYQENGELDWWLSKSPAFYAEDEVLAAREEYWNDEESN